MKRHEQSFRKFLDQSFARFRNLPPAPVDPAWERVLDRLQEEPDAASEAAQVAIDSIRPMPPLMMRRPVWVAAAAAVVFAAVLSVVLGPSGAPALVESVDGGLYRVVEGKALPFRASERVEMGETIRSNGGSGGTLVLADGSRVEMRTRSELSLERADDGVRIRLDNGSVIVNAAKQSAGRRLYVQTKDVTVSVVGTVFLVKAEQQGSRVAVIEGEVRVQKGVTTERLFTGEQVATSSLMPTRPVTEEISWSRHAEEHFAMLQQSTIPPAAGPAEPRDTFEVASIRPSAEPPAGAGARGGGGAPVGPPPCLEANAFAMARQFQLDPSRLVIRRLPLYYLIGFAYGNSCPAPDTLTGGPDWTRTNIFDLEATIPAGTSRYTEEQLLSGNAPRLQRMLQNLLADRFKLVLKREVKEMQGYNLVVAQEGRLNLSADQTPDQTPTAPGRGGGLRRVLTIPSVSAPISRLARNLQQTLGRPIVDKTGLTGPYDIWLEFPEIAFPTAPPDGATLSDIQREVNQINQRVRDLLPAKLEATTGLRLEAAKVPLEALVIASAEKPSEN